MKNTSILLLFFIFLITCGCSPGLKDHIFPDPVDTQTLKIVMQEKTSYRFDGVYVDNTFDGARMNGFIQVNDTTFRVLVSPENYPINASAYFAFRIKSERERKIDLEIEYTKHKHRYIPKLSYDAKTWIAMDSTQFDTLKAPNIATLKLDIDERPLYVAGQELMTSSEADLWTSNLSNAHNYISKSVAGKSKLGRDIYFMDINQYKRDKKDAIVIFSRMHPPEVTGYMAMQTLVETLLEDTPLSNMFRQKYRVLVYPMINPDGVDLGHWRHNAGGIDLNRDWAYYRQVEPDVVANHTVKMINEEKNKVVVGLDFHSTQKDVYYTLPPNRKSNVFGFKNIWLQGIDESLSEYEPEDSSSDLNQPISKGWFFLQFGAEGITYEVGDETPREFVKAKARVAAKEMMKLLVLR